jgi:CHAT domain-containing protein
MQQFYRARQQNGLNKAEALRAAQLSLLHGTAAAATARQSGSGRGAARQPAAATDAALQFTLDPAAPYAHPYFWAPFVLMGNFL